MWGDRSGREPTRARSPLKLRRALSLASAVVCLVGLVALGVSGWGSWWAALLLAALAVVSIVDAVVITRHISTENRDS